MEREAYEAFTRALEARLAADGRAIGLVAVGSMARQGTEPDAWSDHDFFVVAEPGAEEGLRAAALGEGAGAASAASWLPEASRVVYRFRETAHGGKVLYEDGHLLEFAVFAPDELRLARANRYRVLLDRADVARRMAEVAAATAAATAVPPGDAYLAGQLLSGALVAAGRWARGERLSARAFLVGQAVPSLVRLLAAHAAPDAPGLRERLDNLDPLRRFEQVYAALGAALDEVLARPLPAACAGLLALAERELAGRVPALSAAALAAVRGRLGA